MNTRALPHIAALATMIVWSMTFVSTKVLLDHLGPLEILISRTALGFVALCLIRPRFLRVQKRSHEALFALAGLTGPLVYYLGENIALEYADASFVAVTVSIAPLFTAILSIALLKEKVANVRFFAGFAIAMAGIVTISFQGGPGYASPIGVTLCLVAALSWSVYSIAIKRLANLGYETITVTKRVFAWGLAFMVIIWVAKGAHIPFEAFSHPIVWGNLVYLGIFASALCFVTWGFSVKHLGPTSASAYIYLQVPLSVGWAVALLGDPLTAPILIGVVLVIAGLVLSEDFGRTKDE